MPVGVQQYRFLVNTLLFSILQPSSKYILCLKECLWELSRETFARNTAGKAPCCIWAANLASRSVAYTFTQNRIIIFRICQKENVCWEILFSEVHLSPSHLPRKEKSLARPQWQIATRASVCVCVKSSVHFLQISVPSWCRKTTHYRKVGALYFFIHLEDTFINFCQKVSFDIPNPYSFLLPQCVLLAGMHQFLCYLFNSMFSLDLN